MGRNTFSGKKREKEMNRKTKQEQKRQDKLNKKNRDPEAQGEQQPVDVEAQ
jgi:hypothetical protein